MRRRPALSVLRNLLYRLSSALQMYIYRGLYGMDLGNDIRISRSAKLDKTNPRGLHIGNATLISFDVAILAHDFVGNRHCDTFIGSHCFIGARSIIMPGVRVGDHCIIGAGSVVTKNVPANSVAVGNPARVIQRGIATGRWGIRDPEFLSLEERAVGKKERR